MAGTFLVFFVFLVSRRRAARPARRLAEPSWPDPLDAAALHGLAGDVVRAIAPHSEADPLAILLQFLAAFGACCGRTSYAMAEADRHPPQIWPVLVGASSRGRKGTSWGHVQALFERAQPPGWTAEHFVPGGLSSGEGIIWAVRDPVISRDKKTGEETETDPGVRDKRLLVVEAEFATVLRQFERVGNTLSATLRSLWDRGDRPVPDQEQPGQDDGRACLRHRAHHPGRTAPLSRPHRARERLRQPPAPRLCEAVPAAAVRRRAPRRITRPAGRTRACPSGRMLPAPVSGGCASRAVRGSLWAAAIRSAHGGPAGIYGAITARAEAQVLRLSLIYALLDEVPLPAEAIIDVPHLQAALARLALLRRVGRPHLRPGARRPRRGRDPPGPAAARRSA